MATLAEMPRRPDHFLPARSNRSNRPHVRRASPPRRRGGASRLARRGTAEGRTPAGAIECWDRGAEYRGPNTERRRTRERMSDQMATAVTGTLVRDGQCARRWTKSWRLVAASVCFLYLRLGWTLLRSR